MGKFCTIRGTAINITLAMLQMSVANVLSFSDFRVVTIDAGRVAKRWCRKKGGFSKDMRGGFAIALGRKSASRTFALSGLLLDQALTVNWVWG